MYSFISTRDISELHNAYKALYGQDLDKKWNKHVVLCPDLAGAMLSGMTAKKLLTAEFRVLVNVYFHYKNYVNGMTEARRDAVNAAAQAVFTYKSYSTKIAQFLLNPDNKYEIHNCIYCDMEKISSFDHITFLHGNLQILLPLQKTLLYRSCALIPPANTAYPLSSAHPQNNLRTVLPAIHVHAANIHKPSTS